MKRCLEWEACNRNGYGVLWRDGKVRYAHREMYEAWYGPIPDGMFVCHRCDNPRCVNPHHLFLGWHADNMRDCVSKGRNAKGETCGYNKLNNEQVDFIKQNKGRISQKEMGTMFGVHRTTISAIHVQRSWRHL